MFAAWLSPATPEEYRSWQWLFHEWDEKYLPFLVSKYPWGWLCAKEGKITYMSKKKTRRLWLNIKASGVTVSSPEFIRALLDSIEEGDYRLPHGWNVTLEWRNKESAPMRSGRWQDELAKSAKSSDGFDKAVTDWLRRKLR